MQGSGKGDFYMGIASYFQKNTVLETPRLILRRLEVSDAQDMYEYACRPETSKYLMWEAHPYYSYTVELLRFFQREYKEGRYFDFAVVYKENSKMIGTAGFTSYDEKNSVAEAGYVLNPDYHGRGLGTEALGAILNFAFCELNVNRVECRYMLGNDASLKVMKKCGMQKEGVLRSRLYCKGKYSDIGICSILKSEYFTVQRDNIYKNSTQNGFFRLFHKN